MASLESVEYRQTTLSGRLQSPSAGGASLHRSIWVPCRASSAGR